MVRVAAPHHRLLRFFVSSWKTHRQPGLSHIFSLVLFLSPGFVAELYLDAPVEALACTGDRFTVGPLLASIESGPACYVLTVGTENIALFRARRSGWTECDVPDLPRSEKEALWYERDERMSSSHAGGPTGAGGMSIISHGSGAQDEDRKVNCIASS